MPVLHLLHVIQCHALDQLCRLCDVGPSGYVCVSFAHAWLFCDSYSSCAPIDVMPDYHRYGGIYVLKITYWEAQAVQQSPDTSRSSKPGIRMQ